MNTPSEALGRLFRLVVRLFLVAAGAVFFFSLLLAGAIAALGFTLWSLLRGRRPLVADIWRVQRQMRERAQARGFAGGWSARSSQGPAAAAPEDIVEVQAREVVAGQGRIGPQS
ncbi:hypothetical protein SAMN05421778_101204 [Sphaerotilus natans]|uniref:hypothetical protein n=1 Tax=Sphaerotilus natans TaxID=34103 RepID=UPI0005690309|nr:hypothetical protein [Sphaerotilus natans]SIQ03744.1 hypothetical protein SAMN05421778_101204 [Sphaerotilus natans]